MKVFSFYEHRRVWNMEEAQSLSQRISSIDLSNKNIEDVDEQTEQEELLKGLNIEKEKIHEALVLLQGKIELHFVEEITGKKQTGIDKVKTLSEYAAVDIRKASRDTKNYLDDLNEGSDYNLDAGFLQNLFQWDSLGSYNSEKVKKLKDVVVTLKDINYNLSKGEGLLNKKTKAEKNILASQRKDLLIEYKNLRKAIKEDLIKERDKKKENILGKNLNLVSSNLTKVQKERDKLKEYKNFLPKGVSTQEIQREIKKLKPFAEETYINGEAPNVSSQVKSRTLIGEDDYDTVYSICGEACPDKKDTNAVKTFIKGINAVIKIEILKDLQKDIKAIKTEEKIPADTQSVDTESIDRKSNEEPVTAEKSTETTQEKKFPKLTEKYQARWKEIQKIMSNNDEKSKEILGDEYDELIPQELQQRLSEVKVGGYNIDIKIDGIPGVQTMTALKRALGLELTTEEKNIIVYKRKATYEEKELSYDFITRGDLGVDKDAEGEEGEKSKQIRFMRSAENAFDAIKSSGLLEHFHISDKDIAPIEEENPELGYAFVFKIQQFLNTNASDKITEWTGNDEAREEVDRLLTDGRWGRNTDRVFRMYLSSLKKKS